MTKKIVHKFTKIIPEDIEENTLYISMEYRCAVHKCFCGCKEKVVIPFSETDWKLLFYGNSVSIEPSIGNWSYPCQSHYWIIKNKVHWSRKWSQAEIRKNRKKDAWNKKRHHFFKKIKKIF